MWNQINVEEPGKILIALIKNDRQVQRVIMELVLTSPYIVRQFQATMRRKQLGLVT